MRLTPLLLLLAACRDKELPDTSQPPEDSTPVVVDEDADGYAAEEDCDDSDPTVHPGAPEVCDSLDNNCDGQTDEGVQSTWYPDADGDGWGVEEGSSLACTAPSGAASQVGDCDDADPAIHPEAAEDDCADPTDYNCDGSVGYADADADGWAACEDCDDANPDTRPDAAEVCDSVDNDCDNLTDEDVQATWYADVDGDGYGDPDYSALACSAPSGYVADATDCDDTDAQLSPAATEICDSLDNDCDSLVDDADPSLDTGTAATWYSDADEDGYGDPAAAVLACGQPNGASALGTDCDDADAAVSPAATEVCDSVDNDCDGQTDDADSSLDSGTAATWYRDGDGDGFGLLGSTTLACDTPSGYAASSTDCDDSDSAVSPGASEVCNGADDDCDSSGDEGLTCSYKLVQSDLASGLCVDDDVYASLDGTRIYTDSTWGAQCGHVISFSATPGQSLTVWAVDSVGGCRTISDVYIVNVDGGVGTFLATGFANSCGHSASSSAFWSATVAVPGIF